jgi:hypothetical protein
MRYPMPFISPAEDADTDDWLCGEHFSWNERGEDICADDDADELPWTALPFTLTVESESIAEDC